MSGLRADRHVGLFLAGALLLTFLAFGATVVLPATDPAMSEESDALRSFGSVEELGMSVYRSEGCWYCHTQQVRDATADAGLGEPLAPGDYGEHSPAMLGSARIGPDLTHVGSRYSSSDELIALLRDPRADGRHSSMPSYAFLSDGDLEALAAYLLALR